MNFGQAVEALKLGSRVARTGWNGKNMFIVLSEPSETPKSGFNFYINCSEPIPTQPFIVMKTADDKLVPWLASQTDILADDWEILVS